MRFSIRDVHAGLAVLAVATVLLPQNRGCQLVDSVGK